LIVVVEALGTLAPSRIIARHDHLVGEEVERVALLGTVRPLKRVVNVRHFREGGVEHVHEIGDRVQGARRVLDLVEQVVPYGRVVVVVARAGVVAPLVVGESVDLAPLPEPVEGGVGRPKEGVEWAA